MENIRVFYLCDKEQGQNVLEIFNDNQCMVIRKHDNGNVVLRLFPKGETRIPEGNQIKNLSEIDFLEFFRLFGQVDDFLSILTRACDLLAKKSKEDTTDTGDPLPCISVAQL